jgi:O-acetyl-ADP-ribose deacetylase (regulator of RNase III)
MIKIHIGNLLDVTSGVIVHGCNAQGVMGSGVAKAIRDSYPGAYYTYVQMHMQRGLKLGQVVYHVPFLRLFIANAITQEMFGGSQRHADYFAIRKAFRHIGRLVEGFPRDGNFEVHFPLIGAGLANGDWAKISKIIDETIPDAVGKNLWVLNDKTAAEVMAGSSEIHVIGLESGNEKDNPA